MLRNALRSVFSRLRAFSGHAYYKTRAAFTLSAGALLRKLGARAQPARIEGSLKTNKKNGKIILLPFFPYEQIVKIIYGHGTIAVRVKISPSAETFSWPPYFLAISCMLFRPKPCSAASFLQVAGKPSVMRRVPEK